LPFAPVHLSWQKTHFERRLNEAENTFVGSGYFSDGIGALSPALWAAEKEPVVGYNAGNVPFSAPGTPEEATYLGLAGPAPSP
jgi:hypothetical protein